MKIRKANIKDVDAIAKHNIALAKESENVHLIKEMISAGVKAFLADRNKGFYLVAEENNTIVGQLMITIEWSDWRNKPIWWIQSVYVKKKWRKKGIFTKLLNSVQQYAQEHKVAFLRLYVHQNNLSAQNVYEKSGWKQEPYLIYQHPV